MEQTKKYYGIVPPLMTPLRKDETLDEDGLVNIIEYNIKNGVHGIFTLGSSGECVMVSREVWKKVNQITLETVKDRVPVYCGAIDCGTTRVLENVKELEQMGAKIICATPHFYMNNSSQDEIVRHYEQICQQTSMKMMVYGHKIATNVDIEPDTMLKIAQIDNVIAFKDTRPDWGTHISHLFTLKETGLTVFGGGEEFFTASMLMGSDGNISGLINVFPKLFVDTYDATVSGDMVRIHALQKELLDVKKEVGYTTWLTGMKYVAHKLGLIESETASSPIQPLQNEDRRRIDALLEKLLITV